MFGAENLEGSGEGRGKRRGLVGFISEPGVDAEILVSAVIVLRIKILPISTSKKPIVFMTQNQRPNFFGNWKSTLKFIISKNN
jgi:hypothetical protein